MFGTIVNALAIILGGLIGILVRGGFRANYRQTIMQAISLAVLLIGLKGALQSGDLLIVIGSLVIGGLVGEYLQIEERLAALGKFIETRMHANEQGFAHGFVTASLVFCVGAMAIVGSLESGLSGNHQTLYAKSILDGIAALIFSSTLGIGVLFSAVSVFLYQGSITLAAVYIQPLLTPEIIAQMTSVGGMLIMAIGINLMEIKTIKVGNLLPGIFVPLVYFLIKNLFA